MHFFQWSYDLLTCTLNTFVHRVNLICVIKECTMALEQYNLGPSCTFEEKTLQYLLGPIRNIYICRMNPLTSELNRRISLVNISVHVTDSLPQHLYTVSKCALSYRYSRSQQLHLTGMCIIIINLRFIFVNIQYHCVKK